MDTRTARRHSTRRTAAFAAILLAGAAWPALAQTAPADPQDPPGSSAETVADPNDEIVVSGYRASLESSTNAKKNSTGFSDTIFAEDIGKFPDTNIAESFNRIPGVTISREVTGEGLSIAIRGLGTNFTKVLLNGAPVAVASTGRTDSQNTNREVDLDLFPTELFTSLTVNKSGMASMIEGGAAGTVNMRSARPFDREGTRVTYGAQLTKNTNSDKWGYRGSLLASTTMGDFGILLGVAGVHNQVRTTGFETIGWTNPNLSTPNSIAGTTGGVQNVPTPAQIAASQCRANNASCNSTGGGNWTIPGTVPANAGNGLTAGASVNQDLLLARNPGATIQQIDNGIIPRLGRPMFEEGTKDRINAIASLEYKGENFHAYVDAMYGWKDNQLERVDMNWVGRNGAMIPLNTTYDRSDCATGCVVTGGTYANAQFFLEYRPHLETVKFWGVNPGLEFEFNDRLKLDIQGNYTKSDFHRESPTVLVITPASSGVTVTYDNQDGNMPVIGTNIDLNNPANFGWPGGRVNIQDERRKTETKGVRGNLTWGDAAFNFRAGAAYDDVSRRISAFDNSQAWQNAVCGNRPSVFVPGPNTQPPCNGLVQPGAAPAGYPTYPAFGTGFTAGQTGPVTYAGSLISNAQVPSFLRPTSSGFVTVDWERFKAASNYDAFHDSAPEAGSANTGANGGYVREKSLGLYAELNGDTSLAGGRINYNVGLRYVRTNQTIGGRVSVTDPRNGTDPDGAGPLPNACPGTGNPRDGSCYPNVVSVLYTESDYDNWLPSGSAAFHITENAVVRAAASRTMTRPNPNTMLPGLSFTSPSADAATIGNPALNPYLSTNFDLGFEYYTGQEGYVGFTAFRKALTGFTVNSTTTAPFSTLAPFGITYDTLSATQQAAITARGGPAAANITLQQQVNASGTLKVNGLEATWVQPLDFLLGRYLGINGFGFNANLTLIEQTGSGAAPAVAVGVSPVTYNITGYYEQNGLSVRLSTTFQRGSVSSDPNQNGIALARFYSDDYQQFDLTASVDFADLFDVKWAPQLTLDVINLTKAQQRSYFQFENAAYTLYEPGRQVMIGLRGRF
ncbi:TonB-dependent receptor [Sphingomonas psychrotolerans]|uniref:TonB-dependent receptor n=1 Tax=Sphingomonas psychrotolerans TaxID=1327635 RepID=A0A2K8MFH3_9SPHN|nr:TonB-dependent receptor [Sphingomonas psychrotolerans]ATY32625.1 TonB-dependent receptor [Sphingomonas psychrotolerans]